MTKLIEPIESAGMRGAMKQAIEEHTSMAAGLVHKIVDKVVSEAECMMCGKAQPATGWFWIGCGEEDVEFLCSEECYEQHTFDPCEAAPPRSP